MGGAYRLDRRWGREMGQGLSREFTVSLSQVIPSDTVVSYSVGGTAMADDDYNALSGSVTIPANQSSATIAVPVVDDSDIEAAESVVISLTGATNGVELGAANEATILIEDNEVANVVSIATTTAASEPSSNGVFTVSLDTAATAVPGCWLRYWQQCTPGIDYTTLSGTATIMAGQTSATIDIAVADDGDTEGQSIIVILDSIIASDTNVVFGASNIATVNIADDEVPLTTLTFEAEGADTITGDYINGTKHQWGLWGDCTQFRRWSE